MLKKLVIRNYALIQELDLNFEKGFITITGETGAGKSILLDALGLILGERANPKAILNQTEKCSVEAIFDIKNYQLKSFFDIEDLDYEPLTIIRREITTAGKSRAFINDTPVLLEQLQNLGEKLLDIHSQHDTASITQKQFQLDLLDYFGDLISDRNDYFIDYQEYKSTKQILEDLLEKQQQQTADSSYQEYLLKELQEAKLQPDDQTVWEQEAAVLTHAEDIKIQFNNAIQTYGEEQNGIEKHLKETIKGIDKIKHFDPLLNDFYERLQSSLIELEDIFSEMAAYAEGIEYEPQRLQDLNQKLQQLYELQKKHKVADIQSLLEIKKTLETKLSGTENLQEMILVNQKKLAKTEEKLIQQATILTQKRTEKAQKLAEAIEIILAQLGMPDSKLKIMLTPVHHFTAMGCDKVEIMMQANTGTSFQPIAKAASGGERARLMLAIKKILAEKIELPTLILDEIDTGVSGKIAAKMGQLMADMQQNTQLIAVTHLPQIAAKGTQHFKVFKTQQNGAVQTYVNKLTKEERIDEIAQMLSGSNITDTAKAQAKLLLTSE